MAQPSTQVTKLTGHLTDVQCKAAQDEHIKEAIQGAEDHCGQIEEIRQHPEEMRDFQREGFTIEMGTLLTLYRASGTIGEDGKCVFPLGKVLRRGWPGVVDPFDLTTHPMDCIQGFWEQMKNDGSGLALLYHSLHVASDQEGAKLSSYWRAGGYSGVSHALLSDAWGMLKKLPNFVIALAQGIGNYLTEDFKQLGCYSDKVRREKACKAVEKIATILLTGAAAGLVGNVAARAALVLSKMAKGIAISAADIRNFVAATVSQGGKSGGTLKNTLAALGKSPPVKLARGTVRVGKASVRGVKNAHGKVKSVVAKVATTPVGKLVAQAAQGTNVARDKAMKAAAMTAPGSLVQQKGKEELLASREDEEYWCDKVFRKPEDRTADLNDPDTCNQEQRKDPAYCQKNPKACTDVQILNQQVCRAYQDPAYRQRIIDRIKKDFDAKKINGSDCRNFVTGETK